MMHLTVAGKSLFIGDDAARAVLEYATALADRGRADQVTVRAIGDDGNEVEVSFVLDPGVVIAAETTNATIEPPDNDFVVADMRRRIGRLTHRVAPTPRVSGGFDADGDHWPEEY
ncbi:hypothetical protein [Agromyces sp. NPDC057865]|uniref:hypothetical protein n=1 Tax=Agromyces sp. NPDC057865 TaxID=3346267 RepID=UPI003672D5E9